MKSGKSTFGKMPWPIIWATCRYMRRASAVISASTQPFIFLKKSFCIKQAGRILSATCLTEICACFFNDALNFTFTLHEWNSFARRKLAFPFGKDTGRNLMGMPREVKNLLWPMIFPRVRQRHCPKSDRLQENTVQSSTCFMLPKTLHFMSLGTDNLTLFKSIGLLNSRLIKRVHTKMIDSGNINFVI